MIWRVESPREYKPSDLSETGRFAELASHSGVSKAMLSAIERSETSPTAALLVRISTAFDMTLSTLIAHAEASSGNLARADVQPVWTDPEPAMSAGIFRHGPTCRWSWSGSNCR
jgi:transcriptional regulator with XRE-family HTH domain